ncbi:MAG: flavodoxin-dependent (E)-4-hydroxy-3-methylbut-2-enyl-diphosphate synthase [Nitrospinota bacterium]|nr:flavodoxin-dependent (E)-4-hydroxy-3-methylbut-2-enyl-diphosphate synthase [Nitrospinota bacterium]
MRRKTKSISVGNISIGSSHQISVQSMTNTDTRDIASTVKQIKALTSAGCEIVRVAVPDTEAAEAISKIKRDITIPLIADIHFDHKLAIISIESGADGIRINPGNIGSKVKVAEVAVAAKEKGVPIRIGVNAGSIAKALLVKHGGPTAGAMVESALEEIKYLEDLRFDNIKISLKASDVNKTVAAYRALAQRVDYPFHVGISEAGTKYSGTIKSSVGIGILLNEGLGDTIRVSLTGDPMEEVQVAYEILKSLDIRRETPELISCPTCGRCQIDLAKLAEAVESRIKERKLDIRVAVMGCLVNGPGEAREADIGISGGKGEGVLFKKGKIIKKVKEDELLATLLEEIDKWEEENKR